MGGPHLQDKKLFESPPSLCLSLKKKNLVTDIFLREAMTKKNEAFNYLFIVGCEKLLLTVNICI